MSGIISQDSSRPAETTSGAQTKADVVSARLTRNLSKLRERVVGTRMFIDASAGTNLAVQTRTFTYVIRATDNASHLKFHWANQANGVAMTIKASLVVGSTVYPLQFSGQRTKTWSPGSVISSDPIGIRIAKGTDVTVRTYVDAGSGNVIKPNGGNFFSGVGGTWTGGSTGVADYTDTAVGSLPAIESPTYFGVVPHAMTGYCANPCLLAAGDSVMAGTGNASTYSWVRENYGPSSTSTAHVGFNANISSIHHGGDSLSAWVSNNYYLKKLFARYCDIAIVGYGVNDSASSLATMQANSLLVWNELAELGIPIYACTLTPWTTSTDSWATVNNQTDSRPNIILFNDWVRTLPAPLTGYFEVSDAVCSARNSGKWKAGFTVDGLHPNVTGQIPLRTLLPSGFLNFTP